MTEPRLCKDCRWAVNTMPGYTPRPEMATLGDYAWRCQHSSATRPAAPPSPVTGAVLPAEQMTCAEARGYGDAGFKCGPKGLFWEGKLVAPELSGLIGFGEPEPHIEPDPVRRLKDLAGWVIEEPDEDDEGGWEWVPLSPRETGLPFKIDVCEVGPIVVARKEGHLTRAEMNDLYRWIALNAEALIAHQKGEIHALQFCERLRKLN